MIRREERAQIAALTAMFLLLVLVIAVPISVFATTRADASTGSSSQWSNHPEPYTMSYLGRPLHCMVVGDGAEAGMIGGLTCDYARYWRNR